MGFGGRGKLPKKCVNSQNLSPCFRGCKKDCEGPQPHCHGVLTHALVALLPASGAPQRPQLTSSRGKQREGGGVPEGVLPCPWELAATMAWYRHKSIKSLLWLSGCCLPLSRSPAAQLNQGPKLNNLPPQRSRGGIREQGHAWGGKHMTGQATRGEGGPCSLDRVRSGTPRAVPRAKGVQRGGHEATCGRSARPHTHRHGHTDHGHAGRQVECERTGKDSFAG